MIIVICETSAPCTFGHCLSHSAAKEGEPITLRQCSQALQLLHFLLGQHRTGPTPVLDHFRLPKLAFDVDPTEYINVLDI